MTDLTREQLDAIGDIPSCAIANAIETFDIQGRDEGFMLPHVGSIFPELGNMIGYAVTGIITASAPPSPHMRIARTEWVDYVLSIPEPRVIVLHDLDYPDVIGSYWGEVQSNVHKALGAVGTVTDGGRARPGRDARPGILRLRQRSAGVPRLRPTWWSTAYPSRSAASPSSRATS